jgi:hypothetical protein
MRNARFGAPIFLIHKFTTSVHSDRVRLLPRFLLEKNRFEKRRRALIFFGISGAVVFFCALVAFLMFVLQTHRSV